MCAEKVERDCSILCSSPMSAKIFLKMPVALPSLTGTNKPDWIISVNNPIVLSVTVLPPVLGPVITITLISGRNTISLATAFFGSKSGCLAFNKEIGPFGLIFTRTLPFDKAYPAFAKIKSNLEII